jgi:hypothetical protein
MAASLATAGLGTVIAINTGTASTPTWTTIGESAEITPSGYQNKTDEVTNFGSTAVEHIFTIQDGGSWDIMANRVSSDTGQSALQTAFAAGTTKQFKATLPKNASQTTAGDNFQFSAIVEKFQPSIKVDKATKMAITLKVTNGVTFTAGS